MSFFAINKIWTIPFIKTFAEKTFISFSISDELLTPDKNLAMLEFLNGQMTKLVSDCGVKIKSIFESLSICLLQKSLNVNTSPTYSQIKVFSSINVFAFTIYPCF